MTDETPSCTCLSISRDPLCVYHGDIDKVSRYTVADFEVQAGYSEDNALPITARMLRQAALLRAQVDKQEAELDHLRLGYGGDELRLRIVELEATLRARPSVGEVVEEALKPRGRAISVEVDGLATREILDA